MCPSSIVALRSHPKAGGIAAEIIDRYEGVQTIFDRMIERTPSLESIGADFLLAYERIVRCLDSGGILFAGGNGGSYSDALHITGELLKSFDRNRLLADDERQAFDGLPYGDEVSRQIEHGFRAVALGSNGALATAVQNDFVLPKMAFAQELFAMARQGDILLGISTSGNARNLMYAIAAAKAKGVATIALTGQSGGEMAAAADIAIRVPAKVTSEVQELHLPTYHALCAMIEARKFGGGKVSALPPKGSVLPVDQVAQVVDHLRRSGKRIVWTNGCFDILHLGHVTYLKNARERGDILVVGINSDSSIRALKGPDRPIIAERQRAEILTNLTAVDYVTIFEDHDTVQLLERVKPDVYAKGGDYSIDTINADERRVVESYGGEIAILPKIDATSTTVILDRIKKA